MLDRDMCCDTGLASTLCDEIGKTVTIFTSSGGQSGCGFTGVIIKVNPCFVRLVTCIGPAPSCALGNGCSAHCGFFGGFNCGFHGGCPFPQFGCFRPIRTIGSTVDIPIDKIVAIVRNAV